ncbi:MAG: NADH-quinone oxidoreductase subunit J [Propionibacteriaceae bacterium]
MIPALIPLVSGSVITFWFCAVLMVPAALGMVFAKKPVHAALCLAAVMVLLAFLYGSLNAPFLLMTQIIVYTGAVLMLFLFVVMLVGVEQADSLVESIKGQRIAAIVAVVALAAMVIGGIGNAIVTKPIGLEKANKVGGDNVGSLAEIIFSDYVFAFEAASALLLTAALAAMVLAHRERFRPKAGQAAMQRERIRRYATSGEHPGALPAPGVYARSNNIATPALLPDGTVSERSVSKVLASRNATIDPASLAAPTVKAFEQIESIERGELEK